MGYWLWVEVGCWGYCGCLFCLVWVAVGFSSCSFSRVVMSDLMDDSSVLSSSRAAGSTRLIEVLVGGWRCFIVGSAACCGVWVHVLKGVRVRVCGGVCFGSELEVLMIT